MPAKVILVTGAIGSGKTTYLIGEISSALQAGQTVAGVVSPGVYRDGARHEIMVAEPHSGHRYLLGRRGNHGSPIETPNWSFEPEAFLRANKCLRQLPPADILVIDELGPLEFHRHQGFSAAFEAIGNFELSYVVVRNTLLDEALERWPHADVYKLSP